METLYYIFMNNRELNAFQMTIRAFVVFFLALIFLRISGRRSFGLKMPLDVVVTILLGSILSRSIVGASPFLPSLAAAFTLAILHRICGVIGVYNKTFSDLVKGTEKIVYENGRFDKKNMVRCMVTEHDLMECVRGSIHMNSVEKVKKIFVERDGSISIIIKENDL